MRPHSFARPWTLRRGREAAVLALFVAACRPAASPKPPCTTAATSTAAEVPEKGVPLTHAPDLRASWTAPSRASYRADLLGAGKQPFALRLANVGTHRVAVDRVSVTFTATRDGVPFACDPRAGATATEHEPASLAPGQSFVFERQIDCATALPGRYEIETYVSLQRASSEERRDFVGTLGLEVAAENASPLRFPGRSGLYTMMTGGEVTRPLPPESWARGDYHVVLAFVNGSKEPVALGAGQLAFLTYRRGSSLACSGQSEAVALPETLAPGAIHVVRAPVTCAPSEEGTYEIVGRFKFFGVSDEIEVGRVSLKVVRSPFLYVPEPRGDCGNDCPKQWLK